MVHLTAHILAQAHAGQEAAVAAVLAHLMPAVRRMAALAVCPGLEFDDAVQEGIIGLFRAIKTYSQNKGATFETYACTCVQNAVIAAQRAAGRKKHAPLNQGLPLNEAAPTPGPEEIAIQNELMESTLLAIQTRLSSFEQEVLSLFLAGGSYGQIAHKLGRTEKAVENALTRLRRKLRQINSV